MSIDPTLTPVANQLINKHKAKRRLEWRGSWYTAVAVTGAILAAALTIYLIPARQAANAEEEKATVGTQLVNVSEQAQISADTQLLLCLGGDETAKKLEEAGSCEAARRLKALIAQSTPPPATGAQGQPGQIGPAGRGILATAIINGRFQITYSDGTVEDKGQILGAPGPAGRGITGSTINNGRLVLVYSDGTSEDVGPVLGKDGKDGKDGANGKDGKDGPAGRGIVSVSASGGRLTVSYSDGSSADVGPLPKGEPPVGWTVYNADGSVDYRCQRVTDFNPDAPQYDCPRPAPPSSSAPTSGG